MLSRFFDTAAISESGPLKDLTEIITTGIKQFYRRAVQCQQQQHTSLLTSNCDCFHNQVSFNVDLLTSFSQQD